MAQRWIVVIIGLLVLAGVAAGSWWLWPASPAPKPVSQEIRQVGTMLAVEIAESSGLVESRIRPGVYWTHNDHGSRSALFAITRNGDSVNRFLLDVPNNDMEDIAMDEEGRLYLGDIGDNDRERDLYYVYRFSEPDPRGPSAKVPLASERRWQLRCPKESLNFEALFVWKGFGYLIAKNSKQQQAGLYRFPLDAPDEPRKLEGLGKLGIREPVTAADIRRDGRLLAVLTYAGVYVYRIDGEIDRVRTAEPLFVPIRGQRIEACCFTTGGILITAETREIFFCPVTAYARLAEDAAPVTQPTTRRRK